jgi:hypothetical protein
MVAIVLGFSGYLFAINITRNRDVVIGTGTIVYLSFEGGFYGIVGDDGKHYDPLNLSQEFKVSGLRVYFEAKILHDVLTYHMWGTPVSILEIQRLG